MAQNHAIKAATLPVATETKPDATPAKVKLDLKDTANYGKRIVVVATGNPKKPGSQSATDFTHYRNGMTVLTYLKDERMPRYRARANILWDVQHGFIRLEDEAKSA